MCVIDWFGGGKRRICLEKTKFGLNEIGARV